MGLRRPFQTEEENAMLPGNQLMPQQEQLLPLEPTEIDESTINLENNPEVAKIEETLRAKIAPDAVAKAPLTTPAPDAKTSKIDFYDNLLQKYAEEKEKVASSRNKAAIGDSISNFLGDLYRMNGGEGLTTRSNAAGAFDEQSKNALDELKTKASLRDNGSNQTRLVDGSLYARDEVTGIWQPVIKSELADRKVKVQEDQVKIGQGKLGVYKNASEAGIKNKDQGQQFQATEAFTKDPMVQAKNEGIEAANLIDSTVDLEIAGAQEAIKTMLAKASGEKGALTDRDVSRFGGSQAIISNLNRALTTRVNGKMTEEDKKYVKDLAAAYKRQALSTKLEKALDISRQQNENFPEVDRQGYFNRYTGLELQEKELKALDMANKMLKNPKSHKPEEVQRAQQVMSKYLSQYGAP